jgi:hypothetical protein
VHRVLAGVLRVLGRPQAEVRLVEPGARDELRESEARDDEVVPALDSSRRSRSLQVGTWAGVKSQMVLPLLGEMARFDPAAAAAPPAADAAKGGADRRWEESSAWTEGVTADNAWQKGSKPVLLMFKWLEVARLVRAVAEVQRVCSRPPSQ